MRKGILPGNTKSLWDAVKIAKDQNVSSIPKSMKLNGANIDYNKLPEKFGDFFTEKVRDIIASSTIDDTIYNL